MGAGTGTGGSTGGQQQQQQQCLQLAMGEKFGECTRKSGEVPADPLVVKDVTHMGVLVQQLAKQMGYVQ